MRRILRIAPLVVLLLGLAQVDAMATGKGRPPSAETRRKLSASAKMWRIDGKPVKRGPNNRVARTRMWGSGVAQGPQAPRSSPASIDFRPARTGRPGSVRIDIAEMWTFHEPGDHVIKLWAHDAQGERFDLEGVFEVGPRLDGYFKKVTFRAVIPAGRSMTPHQVRNLAHLLSVRPEITWTKAASAR